VTSRPPGLSKAHGAVVDLPVGAQRALDASFRFAKREGRAQRCRNLRPSWSKPRSASDGVLGPRFQVAQAVALRVLAGALHGAASWSMAITWSAFRASCREKPPW